MVFDVFVSCMINLTHLSFKQRHFETFWGRTKGTKLGPGAQRYQVGTTATGQLGARQAVGGAMSWFQGG